VVWKTAARSSSVPKRGDDLFSNRGVHAAINQWCISIDTNASPTNTPTGSTMFPKPFSSTTEQRSVAVEQAEFHRTRLEEEFFEYTIDVLDVVGESHLFPKFRR
jgi:hypothetical protein